ncbi:MAG: DNA primase [Patescibacteria group bacterium]|nr:DNA primase [Patescibacteria group bacterium]
MINSPVQEIKDRLDIVEFIRSYVQLLPAGKNFRACCPFHKEKTPSFMVSPDRQTWHCFGACAEGGDIFKFVMKHDNLEFYEALNFLAEKAGVELRKFSPADQRQFGVLYDINDFAKKFFQKQLEFSKEANEYLANRGLKKETIEEFEIGFAPQSFDNLTVHLINSGYAVADIERAGLNFKSERGGYIDRFRGRIMFPIYNHFGKTIGFSARILPQYDNGETGKYINSPETAIFNKSKVLYGFHKSKNFIKEKKEAVLVEGQMDFLMAWQDGMKNVAATSGTALTPDHLAVLWRLTDKVIFCFDNDEAGLKAAERSIDLAQNRDFSVRLLILEDYKDPADAVKHKPGILEKLAQKAKPAMEFYFNRYLQSADKRGLNADKRGNISDLKNNIRVVLAKIKNLASPIERQYWLHELALKTRVKEEALNEEMGQLKIPNYKTQITNINTDNAQNNKIIPETRMELLAQKLIGLMSLDENLYSIAGDFLEYLPENYSMVARSLVEKVPLESEEHNNLLGAISLKTSFEIQIFDQEKINNEFQELARQLRLEYLRNKRQELVNALKEAESDGGEKDVEALLREFDEISKLMHN